MCSLGCQVECSSVRLGIVSSDSKLSDILRARVHLAMASLLPDSPRGSTAGELEKDLEAEFEWIKLPGGETLFREGDPGDSLYILVSGRLAAVVSQPGSQARTVAEISPGETVGEMAVLTGEGRSASVVALRDSELARLTKARFDHLVEKHPRALMQIAALMVTRLKRANRGASPRASVATIAVVPAGTGGGPATDFARHLAAALEGYGSALHLNSATQSAPDGIDGDLLESRYRYIVFECDSAWTPWTERCLRQADRIVLAAGVAASPQPNEIEQHLDSASGAASARRELVLLHADGREPLPGRAAQWLERRSVAMHHHAGQSDPASFARLARFLTGRAIGLALSGGGARGFVHVGVIRALREAGIPVDAVTGTSMGSIIAAQCALEWDGPAMLDALRQGFVDLNPMGDYTVPVVSMLRGKRMVKMLSGMFGNVEIEDMPRKYFCVSANLTTGEVMTHERGLLRKYLRASSSVPGLLPPVWDRGALLVDGGLLNNLPADEMCRYCDKSSVIAVNCNPQRQLASREEFGESLSFSQVLWRSVLPRRKSLGLPNIHQILERTTMLASIGAASAYEHGGIGLYLHPPTDEFSFLDVKRMEYIAEQGALYALPKIEAWKKAMNLP